MVSVKSTAYDEYKWSAFPGFLVSLVELFGRIPIRFYRNRPNIKPSFSVLETISSRDGLFHNYGLRYYLLSVTELKRYSVIPFGTQRELNKKLNGCSVYIRSSCSDILGNPKWVSAKYQWKWTSLRVIDFMESPILLFDCYCFSNIAEVWCSGFVSFLRFGFLGADSLYRTFYLGNAPFKFS